MDTSIDSGCIPQMAASEFGTIDLTYTPTAKRLIVIPNLGAMDADADDGMGMTVVDI